MEHFVKWNIGESNRRFDFITLPAPGAPGIPSILCPEVPDEEVAIVAAGDDAHEPNVLTPEARHIAQQLVDMKAFSVRDARVRFLALPDASARSISELVETGIVIENENDDFGDVDYSIDLRRIMISMDVRCDRPLLDIRSDDRTPLSRMDKLQLVKFLLRKGWTPQADVPQQLVRDAHVFLERRREAAQDVLALPCQVGCHL